MVGLFHGKSQSKMDDLGVPLFQETSIDNRYWLVIRLVSILRLLPLFLYVFVLLFCFFDIIVLLSSTAAAAAAAAALVLVLATSY